MSKKPEAKTETLQVQSGKKNKSKKAVWYKAAGDIVWNSKIVKLLSQAVVVACVAYTALDQLTSLTAVQQLQGAVALVSTFVVINRAFKK